MLDIIVYWFINSILATTLDQRLVGVRHLLTIRLELIPGAAGPDAVFRPRPGEIQGETLPHQEYVTVSISR